MKYFISLIAMLMAISLSAQEAPAYAMYENTYFTPKYDKIAEFSAAFGAHNKMYHSDGPFQVNVFFVNSGPNVGKVVSSSGPHTWADLDARPTNEAHDQDWVKNVMPHIAKIEDGGNWRLMVDQSYVSEGSVYSKLRINVVDVESGEGDSHRALMKKLAQTQKGAFPTQSRLLFNRRGFRDDGRDRAIVIGLNNWADLDINFREGYEKVHGEGSWEIFIEEINEATVSSFGELWDRSSAMSGPAN